MSVRYARVRFPLEGVDKDLDPRVLVSCAAGGRGDVGVGVKRSYGLDVVMGKSSRVDLFS